jgi:hypothetical protein
MLESFEFLMLKHNMHQFILWNRKVRAHISCGDYVPTFPNLQHFATWVFQGC